MKKFVKCLVWDLDDVIWDGTLLEGDDVILRPNIPTILEGLNNRGILNSIASRNEENLALSMLRKFDLEKYFIAPQVNFNPKPDNLRSIAKDLNLSLDSLAFVDDSPFEREGVKFSCPSVHVIEAERYTDILDMPEFKPPSVTIEARDRLEVYKTESKRLQAEEEFSGTRLDFLRSCQIHLLLRKVEVTDIPRIVELSYRTNQFNATGIQYNADEVKALMESSSVRVFIAELSDRFGNYGIVGVMILRLDQNGCVIESLMISCRVAGRGVSAAMLLLSMLITKQTKSKILQVYYRPTDRNRQLEIFYRILGFQQEQNVMENGMTLWAYNLQKESIPEMPVWLKITNPFDNLVV